MNYRNIQLEKTKKVKLLQERIAQAKMRIANLEQAVKDEDCLALSRIVSSDPGLVLQMSLDLRLIRINHSFARFTGYGDQLSRGQSVEIFFDAETMELLKAGCAQIKDGFSFEPIEVGVKCQDGKTKTALLGLTRIGSEQDELIAYFLDIDERTKLADKLAYKEANLRALTSVIPQLLWVSDADGAVIYANDKFYSYTGIAKESEEEPLLWAHLLHPSDQVNFSGVGFSVGEIYADFQSEVRICDKDGVYKWHLLKVVPFFDADRASLNWLTIAADIDEQRRVTDALMASEEQLRLIADALPQIVWTADAVGQIDFWNHRWFEYTGLTAQQSSHGGWRLLIHSEDLPVYDQAWSDALAKGEAFEVQFRLKRVLGLNRHRRNGRERDSVSRDYLWHLCRAVPVKDAGGKVLRWFGTWTEVQDHHTALN